MEGGHDWRNLICTPEQVFDDFKGRRNAIIAALTTEVEDFYQQCDPEKENFCLVGYPSGRWSVTLPEEQVPSEIPEPALGINFARDGMRAKEWLALVAAHSEGWLFSVAFYFAARFGFDKTERKTLFNMINELPTVFEIVTAAAKKQLKERISLLDLSRCKLKPTSESKKRAPVEYHRGRSMDLDPNCAEDGQEDEEEHGTTMCGACGLQDGLDEFWICCDACERWFHGRCVKITPAKAQHLKHYKCSSCSSKRSRPH